MRIEVSMSGPIMGDITIDREMPNQRTFADGPDRDAEECARMLEQIAGEIRRMFPKVRPEHVINGPIQLGGNGYWHGHCRCGWYVTELGQPATVKSLNEHIAEAS